MKLGIEKSSGTTSSFQNTLIKIEFFVRVELIFLAIDGAGET